MGFYEQRVLPHLIHLGMRQEVLLEYRQRVIEGARGRVLEIGVGSGLNLPLYHQPASLILAVDTSPRLLLMARHSRPRSPIRFELLEGSAEALPVESESIDTVVTSWTLCSIPNVMAALREARRVLKPSGQLRFVEHGRAPDAGVQRWQNVLTPAWKRLTGGCHLNRPILELFAGAGFGVERVSTGYMQGPRPMTFMYEGVARPG